MNRARSWGLVLLPLTRCGCHREDRCPCWPNSFVGKFRLRPLSALPEISAP